MRNDPTPHSSTARRIAARNRARRIAALNRSLRSSSSIHSEDASVQLVVVVSFDGLRKLVDWVAAGGTFDERRRRGDIANRAVDELLTRTDHARMNEQIRSALRFDHAHARWTWSPPNPSRN